MEGWKIALISLVTLKLNDGQWLSVWLENLPKHVKDKYEAMHVPGQSGRKSAGSVVVVGWVVAGVGTGGRKGLF